jgi:hypothetical protein
MVNNSSKEIICAEDVVADRVDEDKGAGEEAAGDDGRIVCSRMDIRSGNRFPELRIRKCPQRTPVLQTNEHGSCNRPERSDNS